jgi:uncharacterized membrane protein
MSHRQIIAATLAAALAATAFAGPALARPIDDQRALDAALAQERSYGSSVARPSDRGQDLRSPDARDAAEGRGTFSAPDVTVIKVTQPAPTSSGIDWADAGLGAGSLLALTLLALGGAFAAVHRRRGARQTATAA